jgi:hypothetical protein
VAIFLAIVCGAALVGVHSSASAHDWYPDDHCGTGLSPDRFFYAGGPAQFWYVTSGGWNNCHLETYTATSLINYAHWYLDILTTLNHTYALQAYVSSAGPRVKTTEAIYQLWCCGHSGGVSEVRVLNQRANQSGFCYWLSTRWMSGSQGGFSEIIDRNTKQDGVIYVDLFCFRTQ